MKKLVSLLLMLVTACAEDVESAQELSACRITRAATPLPPELEESSGVAVSRRYPDLIWTHNDSGGEPVVFGVRASGELVARVSVGGTSDRGDDWEDIALGPCPSGECLYIADVGDNDAEREQVTIYRLPEPDPANPRPAAAERFAVRYPGGPRDAEALFVTPEGELYIVTKGREKPVALFRYPLPMQADRVVELEHVVDFGAAAPPPRDQVTGAGVSPSGAWVAIRTYEALSLHRAERLLRGDTTPALVADLTPVGEPQGEAVDVLDSGVVVLSSEGGFADAPGSLASLICTLP